MTDRGGEEQCLPGAVPRVGGLEHVVHFLLKTQHRASLTPWMPTMSSSHPLTHPLGANLEAHVQHAVGLINDEDAATAFIRHASGAASSCVTWQ